MNFRNIFFLFILIGLISCNGSKISQVEVDSPNNIVKVSFSLDDLGRPLYTSSFQSSTVLDTSYLGFQIEGVADLDKNFSMISADISSFDETWEQPWGEEQFIRNNYNELKIQLEEKSDLKRKLNIVFRVYDDGVGFRYEFPEQLNLTRFNITNELTEFNMVDDHKAWWIPAYGGNRYEYIYEETPLSKMPKVHTPVTFQTKENVYLSVHEAALQNYSSMVINGGDKRLECELVPDTKGSDVKSMVTAPFNTPWRTIQMADKPGDLITSYLILNLNEPNKLGDVSWFKPGRYVGIWWEMHINTGTWYSGDRHSATTENTKRYIDFAAKHGFDGVLVEGWNESWDGDWMKNGEIFSFTQSYPDYDIDELSEYGKEKGVYVIGHHETAANIENYEKQLEPAFQFLEDHGMKAVKTGYVENGDILSNGKYHHGQFYVEHFRRVIETAARHKTAVVAHEPIKDTGERRTYPNIISREGARGQEYNAWSGDGGNPPSHTTIIPFTRLLSGPMDFTSGVFDIKIPTQPNNQINTTLAKQLALYVIVYSPMQMACDLPENYEKYPDALEFIKEVGVDWETTKVLDAEIGEHISIARKEKGTGNWFVGAITNEDPRKVAIKLDFLDADKTYIAKIYRDGPSAHYIDNPEDYVIEEKEISSADTLDFELGSSGGAAVSIIAQ
ncbi:MAG: glycoside hydrolase family 97 protein [Cyclobacteriaceae bacterium]